MSGLFPRKCTLCFEFDKASRKVQPSSLEVHQWIVNVIGLTSDQCHFAYYDMDEYCFYAKLYNPVLLERTLLNTGGKAEFRHRDGSVSTVSISDADVEIKTVRVFNLPPEVPHSYLKDVLSKYGDVKNIRYERWSSQHLLQCYSGIRSVQMHVKLNIPSHVAVCGYKAQVNYSGQTATCHICNESGHLRQDCPRRTFVLKTNLHQRKKLTLADLVAEKPVLEGGGSTEIVNNLESQQSPVNEFRSLVRQNSGSATVNEIQQPSAKDSPCLITNTAGVETVDEPDQTCATEFPPLVRKSEPDKPPFKTLVVANKRRKTCDDSSSDELTADTQKVSQAGSRESLLTTFHADKAMDAVTTNTAAEAAVPAGSHAVVQ